jgi:hypothetical protein
MVITRQLINKNIIYHDSDNKVYDYNGLDKLINGYKNLLIEKGAKKGKSIVIGHSSSTAQIALVFACCELGMTIVIVGTPWLKGKNFANNNLIDPKLQILLPIDYFIVPNKDTTGYFEVFKNTCRFTICLDDEELDYSDNYTVFADNDTVFLKCTSSGTTDTPKIIVHTHEFLYKLIQRNSLNYYGKMGMLTNLAHGSSPAVYFLPGLISKAVTDFYNLPHSDLLKVCDILDTKNIDIDHILVPYTIMLDNFFATNRRLPNCILHTLGIIRLTWVDKVKLGQVKDIVSIFGTNETSGPFLINKATYDDFAENAYRTIDNFYTVNINSNNLYVTVPVYNSVIKTNDRFSEKENVFFHLGRANLYRINDFEFNYNEYQSEVNKFFKAELGTRMSKQMRLKN